MAQVCHPDERAGAATPHSVAPRPRLELRPARADEAESLHALAVLSKMHWGYSAAQMQVLRPQLRVLPLHFTAQVSVQSAFVGVFAGAVIGFHSLLVDGQACELDNLWVLPAHIGRGFGRQLLAHAFGHAAAHGWHALNIDADPFAAPFYLHCGARQVGQTPAPLPGLPRRVRPQLLLAVPLPGSGRSSRSARA